MEQKDKISFTVPLIPAVLISMGEMLLSLAGQIGGAAVIADTQPDNAAEVFGPSADAPPPVASLPPVDPPGPAGTPPPPPAAVAAQGVDLDAAGLPWDARINPDTKTQLKTGARKDCWKYARNLDPAVIASVEAELKAALAAPAADNGECSTTQLASTPPPGPAATTPTIPPPVNTGGAVEMDFSGVVTRVTELQAAGTVSVDQITAICLGLGLPSFILLGTRLDLVPAFIVELDKLCPPIQ